ARIGSGRGCAKRGERARLSSGNQKLTVHALLGMTRDGAKIGVGARLGGGERKNLRRPTASGGNSEGHPYRSWESRLATHHRHVGETPLSPGKLPSMARVRVSVYELDLHPRSTRDRDGGVAETGDQERHLGLPFRAPQHCQMAI